MSTPTQQEYLLLFRGTGWDKELSPEQIQDVVGRWMAWFERLTQEGKAKAGQPLQNEGKIVRGIEGSDRWLFPASGRRSR
jgi:hypothetical protein